MTGSRSPAISVVLPVCDAAQAAQLPQALASIRAQRAGALEVILVEGGNGQPLAESARALLPDAIVLRQAGAGPAAARDRGLAAAGGAFVSFLDPRDRWTGQALAALARGFRDAPSVDVVQGLVRQVAPGDPAPAGGGRPRPPYPGFDGGALLVRREALLAAGPLAESPLQDADAALFRRLRARGLRGLVIPQVVLEQHRPPGPLPATEPPWLPGAGAAPAAAGAPGVSVVLVVKEGRRYLPAALGSLRRQSVAPAEILAVVAESGDGTLSYLRDQPDLRALPQEGSGLAQARNQGIAAARAEVIAFLDHDDLWQPRKLERQLAVLALFAGPAACITRFRVVRDADAGDPAEVAAPPGQFPRLGWTPSALVAHRTVFRRVGAFDPATGIGCDTDWFFRLRRSGAPCGLAPEVLLDKRLHAGNLSRDNRENRAALFRVIRKNREEQP